MLRMDSLIALPGLLALAACFSTGCALFQPKPTTELTAQVKPNGVEDGKVEAPPGNFTVEVRPAKGKPIAKEQPLAGPLSVQEALEHTKANKKFKRFNLQLHRPLPDGRVHSMILQYDRAAKMVDPEYDYSIQSGDRVIVIEDTTTMLDDFMKQMSMPFGGPNRFTGKDKKTKYRFEG
ncbi:MAG: hypothetical protein L0211_05315 [Planctomycetaceae bacterium]|nr:hypothetical protein [Planctomycetaceae bacterium]